MSELEGVALRLAIRLLPRTLVLPIANTSERALRAFRSVVDAGGARSRPRVQSGRPVLAASEAYLVFVSRVLPIDRTFFPTELSVVRVLGLILRELYSVEVRPKLVVASGVAG